MKNGLFHTIALSMALLAAMQTGVAQQRDSLLMMPWGESAPTTLTSVSSSVVSGEQLEKTPYRDAVAGLTGLLRGVESTMGGNCALSMGARGYASGVCIIDDVPQNFNLVYLEANQIESVSFLNQTIEKAKYGPVASMGTLYIRTRKGGYDTPFTVRAFAETGVGFADWRGEYVGAVDYAILNNQARAASGYTQLYSEEAIAAFAKGDPMDRRYPAVDWKSMMIRNWRPTTRAGIEAFGGTRNIKYSFALNGLADGDYFKVGPDTFSDRINLTTSITARIDKYITAGASFMGMLAYRNEGFGGIYGYADAIPVAFPVAFGLSTGTTDLDNDRAGTPIYAVSRSFPTNPYARLVDGGYALTQNRAGVFGAHVDVDMGFLLKGLSLQGVVNLASQYTLQSGKSNDYLAYYWDPKQDIIDLSPHQGVKAAAKSQLSTSTYQNLTTYGKAAYRRDFGEHHIDATLVGYLSSISQTSYNYPSRYVSLVGSLTYAWKQRYILDLTANRTGSNRYAKEGRFGNFPAAGLAWVASREPFLAGSKWLSFLKIYAQGGILGDFTTMGSNFLYEGVYTLGESSTYGPAPNGQWFGSDTQSVPQTEIVRLANRNLTFPVLRQLEAGLDADLACGVGINANIYQLRRSDMISNLMGRYLSLYGYGSAAWYENYTEALTRGWEATLSYTRRAGDWKIYAALNLMAWDTWNTKLVSDYYLYPWQKQTGRSSGDYVGYVYAGKFETAEQIATLPKYDQTGTRIGDLRYEDLNKDGIIDANDQKVIGNTTPDLWFNGVVDLSWRNWDFNLVLTGQGNHDVYLSGTYFRGGTGDGNYSVFIRDNMGGAYPRLAYLPSVTNGLNSAFWGRKCRFLKLRSLELAYNLPIRSLGVRNARFSLKGADLLTLTNLKETDPESPTAGISAYPFATYVSLGVKLSF